MRRFVVAGDLNLDVVLCGMKAMPSLGSEVLAESRAVKPGGSAANAAMVLAMMGCRVRLFGLVGKDACGKLVLEGLRSAGLSVRTVSLSRTVSTGVTVSLAWPEDRMLVTALGTIGAARIRDLKRGYLGRAAHLHLASYFLQSGLAPEMPGLLRKAKARGMSTSLDPGHDPAERWETSDLEACYPLIDWFLPNADEIRAFTGRSDVEDALQSLGPELRGVVVKAGPEGAYGRWGGAVHRFPAHPAEPVDTTCAGDCFDAGFLFALAAGLSPEEAVGLANRIGALAVSVVGMPEASALRRLSQEVKS